MFFHTGSMRRTQKNKKYDFHDLQLLPKTAIPLRFLLFHNFPECASPQFGLNHMVHFRFACLPFLQVLGVCLPEIMARVLHWLLIVSLCLPLLCGVWLL